MNHKNYVFTIYAECDYEQIDNIFLELFKNNIPVKSPKDAGSHPIEEMIKDCAAILVVLSSSSVEAICQSPYLALADKYNKQIIPYFLENPALFTIPSALLLMVNGTASIPAYQYSDESSLVQRALTEIKPYYPDTKESSIGKGGNLIKIILPCALVLLLAIILPRALKRNPDSSITTDIPVPANVQVASVAVESTPEPVPTETPKPTPTPISQTDMLRDVSNATTKIMSMNTIYDYSTGSGFFISEGGLIATNYHVIDGYEYIYALPFSEKEDDNYYCCSVMQTDPENDLAILQVESTYTVVNYLPLSTEEINIGESVFVSGYPRGIDHTISSGIISNTKHYSNDNNLFFMITAAISPGNSGGPVVNTDGEVLGIASAKYETAENLNLARPVYLLQNLIDQLEAENP